MEKNALTYNVTETDKVEIFVKNKLEAYGRMVYELEIYINDALKMDYVATNQIFK